jgi:hypothetical protein
MAHGHPSASGVGGRAQRACAGRSPVCSHRSPRRAGAPVLRLCPAPGRRPVHIDEDDQGLGLPCIGAPRVPRRAGAALRAPQPPAPRSRGGRVDSSRRKSHNDLAQTAVSEVSKPFTVTCTWRALCAIGSKLARGVCSRSQITATSHVAVCKCVNSDRRARVNLRFR